MKLIKIVMDKSHPSVRQCFVDREDLHRNVQMFFNSSREDAGILYRVNGNNVYVSSIIDPIRQTHNGMTIEYSREMPVHIKGERCRFSIFTQPYKKREGKRIPLIRDTDRMNWLIRQGEKNGFRILSAKEQGFGDVKSSRKGFAIKGYYYMGTLEVTDDLKFCAALEKGIGASKAYGLGMLMVV